MLTYLPRRSPGSGSRGSRHTTASATTTVDVESSLHSLPPLPLPFTTSPLADPLPDPHPLPADVYGDSSPCDRYQTLPRPYGEMRQQAFFRAHLGRRTRLRRCTSSALAKIVHGCAVAALVTWSARIFLPFPLGLVRDDTICIRPVICARSLPAGWLLAVSHCSGYAMYPSLALVFLAKSRTLVGLVERSVLSICIPRGYAQAAHAYCGRWLVFCACVHTAGHLSRWLLQSQLYYLFGDGDGLALGSSGFTGMLSISMLLVTVAAMSRCHAGLPYGVRKLLHVGLPYLLAVTMMYHARLTWLPYVIGVSAAATLLDRIAACCFRIHKVESKVHAVPDDHPRGDGSMLTFRPTGRLATALQKSAPGAFVTLNVLPYSVLEYHPFSVHRIDHDTWGAYIQCTGDWTSRLFEDAQRAGRVSSDATAMTARPSPFDFRQSSHFFAAGCMVTEPESSPCSSAFLTPNSINIATGSCFLPLLSFAHAVADERVLVRRLDIVWITRSASQLELFLTMLRELSPNTLLLIYYTGPKSQLHPLARRLAIRNTLTPGRPAFYFGQPDVLRLSTSLINRHSEPHPASFDHFRPPSPASGGLAAPPPSLSLPSQRQLHEWSITYQGEVAAIARSLVRFTKAVNVQLHLDSNR